MNKFDILEFLKSHRSDFKKQFHVSRIGLFGSFARDEQTPQSDIDLIIELDKNTPNIYELKNSLRTIIEKEFKRPVDIAREKYLKPYAKRQILSETIYAD